MKLLTVKDLSNILQTKESTVRTWIKRGIIPTSIQIRLGTSLRFNEDKVMDWLNNECI